MPPSVRLALGQRRPCLPVGVIPPTSCVVPGIVEADGGSAPGELCELLDRQGQPSRQGGGRRRRRVGIVVGLGPGVGVSVGAGLCDGTRGVGTTSGVTTRPTLEGSGLAAGPTRAGVCAEPRACGVVKPRTG